MKIIFTLMVEQGDTSESIVVALKEEFGEGFTPQMLWDFNRNVMPTPGHFPQAGTMLRVPVDPSARSGGPAFETLHNDALTEDEIRASSTVLGGVKTPSTDGGEPDALQPVKPTPDQEGFIAT